MDLVHGLWSWPRSQGGITVTILGTLKAQGVPPGEILRLEPSSISTVESNLGSSLIFKYRHTAIFPSRKAGVEQNARIELRAGLAVSRELFKVDTKRGCGYEHRVGFCPRRLDSRESLNTRTDFSRPGELRTSLHSVQLEIAQNFAADTNRELTTENRSRGPG